MLNVAASAEQWFEQHRPMLDTALMTIRERTFWNAYPEIPSAKFYGESGKADGEAAFKTLIDHTFQIDQPSSGDLVGKEQSPYGFELGVTYPKIDIDATLAAAQRAVKPWRDAGVNARAGILLEALQRINQQSFLMANAVMHTSGQAFMMAFQAGGPHAQDRALEAIAVAYREMTSVPAEITWEKPQGKNPPIRLEKRYKIVPRGVALVIGCATFPTWNAYPGLFASLATANAVIVKPHPGAILPLAITVDILRRTLRDAGFDANLVQLAADEPLAPIAKELAMRAEIGIIDFTGSSAFGDWLEQNARHALVYTEKAGVNSIVIDSTDDLDAVARNLAFSLCLYSGQMCTTPQDLFIPKSGITVAGKPVSFDAVAKRIAAAVEELTSVDEKAVEVLGAIQSDATLKRLEEAGKAGDVVLASREVKDPRFPGARVRTPLIMKATRTKDAPFEHEQFGPIAFVVATKDTTESIALAMELAKRRGAITGAIYSTDRAVVDEAIEAAADAGVALSCNLIGNIYVNQSSAFSDYHVSGANPAGNAALTDAQFVAGRFRIVQSRMPVA